MKKLLVGISLAGSLGGLPAAVPAVSSANPPLAIAAKTCSSGYAHAVIGRQHKCLQRGQYCARRYNRQYRRYGYRCARRDSYGRYHLS